MRICGLDEAGRGALAGPLVAAAVVLPGGGLKIKNPKLQLKDSKQLNKKQRELLYKEIVDSGAEIAVEIISARQINNRGIGWANKEVFRRLIRRVPADKYIVDGILKVRVRGVSKKIKSIIKADQTRRCVMAAAIIAKVTRDEHMRKLHDEHMMYGWDKNAGYGTKFHIGAIREFGVVRYHRDIFVTTALKE